MANRLGLVVLFCGLMGAVRRWMVGFFEFVYYVKFLNSTVDVLID